MTSPEIIRMLDLIAGLALNPEPVEGQKNVIAYCQMIKEQLLNQAPPHQKD